MVDTIRVMSERGEAHYPSLAQEGTHFAMDFSLGLPRDFHNTLDRTVHAVLAACFPVMQIEISGYSTIFDDTSRLLNTDSLKLLLASMIKRPLRYELYL